MSELSEVEVVNRELYDSIGTITQPTRYGLLDRRLGMSVKKTRCETCGLELADCTGHFGHVRLALPVFHIGYFKYTLSILQCICKTCSRVLLSEDEKRVFFKRLSNPNLDTVQRGSVLKAIYGLCRKVTQCSYCEGPNGIIRKIPPLKIVHEQWGKPTASALKRMNSGNCPKDSRRSAIEAALSSSGLVGGNNGSSASSEGIKSLAAKAQDDLHPLRVLGLFRNIPNEDVIYLGLDVAIGRPEWLIWQNILVPPSCIRPSVEQDGGSNEDDLTIKLTDIVYTNLIIGEALEKGTPVNALLADWDYLQLQVAMYIHSALPGVPPSVQATSRPIRGFVQRLNGKQGRFRGNLSG